MKHMYVISEEEARLIIRALYGYGLGADYDTRNQCYDLRLRLQTQMARNEGRDEIYNWRKKIKELRAEEA